MPPKIKLLIADLGLRYRPTAAADLEAHAASIALLAVDLADLPPDRLERAIATWVRSEKWMPKASELVALCQQQQRDEIAGHGGARDEHDEARAFCAQRNAELWSGQHPRKDAATLEWIALPSGGVKLQYKRETPVMIEPVSVDQVERLNAALARFGAGFRYDPRGWSYDLSPGEAAGATA